MKFTFLDLRCPDQFTHATKLHLISHQRLQSTHSAVSSGDCILSPILCRALKAAKEDDAAYTTPDRPTLRRCKSKTPESEAAQTTGNKGRGKGKAYMALLALKGALAKGKGRGRGGGKTPDAPEETQQTKRKKANMPDVNNETPEELSSKKKTKKAGETADDSPDACVPSSVNADGTEHQTPSETKKKKKKPTCETAESPCASVNADGTEELTTETKKKKKKNTCETAESPAGTEEQTTETKKKKTAESPYVNTDGTEEQTTETKKKKKTTCEAGESPEETDQKSKKKKKTTCEAGESPEETDQKSKKKKTTCEAGESPEETDQKKKKKTTCEAGESPEETDQKKKKAPEECTTLVVATKSGSNKTPNTEEPDHEATTYPESASERRKLKAQVDTEASCTANSFIQSRLEDLKHVIKTPRQYPPASYRDTMAEKNNSALAISWPNRKRRRRRQRQRKRKVPRLRPQAWVISCASFS